MLEVKELTKEFRKKKAVKNISFSIEKGEILGFIGPNGAGKSTSMRMITGYLSPSSGSITIDGNDISKDPIRAKAKTGYLSESSPLYPDMSVCEFLNFCAEARGFSGKKKRYLVDMSMDRCFLSDIPHQIIATLSKGYRQRLSFAQSILHDPSYLILDEPTDGLDPNQKQEVRQMIQTMGEEKAILISTHILDEVESLCPRVILISKGEIIADESPENLRRRDPEHGSYTLNLEKPATAGLMEALKKIAGEERVSLKADSLSIKIHSEKAGPRLSEEILECCRNNKAELKEFFISQGKLDRVFRLLTSAK